MTGPAIWHRCGGAVLAALSVVLSPGPGHAGQFKTLYQFTGGSDGGKPMGDLVVMQGQLYGTTSQGGVDYGVVFKIDPVSGEETVVHAMGGGAVGALPYAGLLAWKGNLWGTTLEGGSYGLGSVFKVNPVTGDYTQIHSFGIDDGYDGAGPEAALVEYNGQLYGTTQSGGTQGNGTAFQVDPNTHQEAVLLSFDGDTTGASPLGRLIVKGDILYGTTSSYPGTIFAIYPKTQSGATLATFSAIEYGISDPFAGLTADKKTFYGTAAAGAHECGSVYAFKLSSNKITKLYAFKDTHRDGNYPVSDLVLFNGTLYGTTSEGGTASKGIVFGINIATKAETILHEFTGGSDGGNPVAGLVAYNGKLYGTTFGGALGYGTVFEVTP